MPQRAGRTLLVSMMFILIQMSAIAMVGIPGAYIRSEAILATIEVWDPANLVINPGFENGAVNWTHGIFPAGSSGKSYIDSPGYYGNCMRMEHGNSTWQANSQIVGKLVPGKVYHFSAWFNTTFTHYGYINLHDRSWKRAEGGTGRSYTVVVQGTNRWTMIEKYVWIPMVDDTGNSTSDDDWSVILYSHYPYEDPSLVRYDNISLVEMEGSKIPSMYREIEELPGWTGLCRNYSNTYPLAPWNLDMIGRMASDGISGDHALVVRGNRTIENSYSITLPVKPDTKYRFSAGIRIENRTAYNYLDLDYPDGLVATQPGIHTTVMGTRGIWCGLYSLFIRDTDGDDVNVLRPDALDHPYISHSDIDWFRESSYLQTSSGSCEMTITIKIEGFEGSLLIDNVTLEEVWSFIDDRYLQIPIYTEFQGMRIDEFSKDPLYVSTNAATFSFGEGRISMIKDGTEVGGLTFLESEVLEDLRSRQEPGLVIIENGNIIISIGADSSAVFKLMVNANITIEGPRPGYHSFEAGIVFSTDRSKGVLFSPIYPSSVLKGMPYEYDMTSDYRYDDHRLEEYGLKNWEVISDFQQDVWKVGYSFQRGDGFLTSVFPPKEFNGTKLHKEKMATAGIDLNQYPDADHSYYVQKFLERNNIMLLWMTGYAVSTNDQAPPAFYYLDENNVPVSPDHPGARAVPFTPIDVAGPYDIEQKEALYRLVQEAHAQNCKVIVYMSPRFFYTSDIDIFLGNLEDNLKEFDLDGVYYDGYYSADPLLNLELVRRTRDLLGDRFYCQHNSWTDTVIRRTDHFRVPFYEAYADRLWVGEAVKKVDEDTFRLNYCGMNVSNTPSTLLSEFRPVNYSLPKEVSLSLAIPVQEQMDMQLKYNGEYRLPPFGYQGFILDRRFQTTQYFDADYYWKKEYAAGREFTSGDGKADVCEDIYTSPDDTAPVTDRAVLKSDGNLHTCETDLSVAQWMIDNEPLYDLHFTFDDRLAKDDSDHRLSPSQNIGYLGDQPAPGYKLVDGRGAFEFGEGRKLYSICDGTLDYTDRSFSCFAVIKRNDTSDGKQVVFSLNDDENIYFGFEGSKFTAYPRDGDLLYGTEEIDPGGYSGNCLRMQHNDATWQAAYQRVGVLVGGSSYNFSVMFKTSPSHRAYVNLYTPDWKDASGNIVGKSFIPPIATGDDGWRLLSLEVTIPLTMDNGEPSSGCQWSVILYSHSPFEDNDPIFYDDVSLWDGSADLVKNGDFGSGFEYWTHYSYIAEQEIPATSEIGPDDWFTVGIVYDRPMLSLYVNGVQENEVRINISDFPRYGNYTIGAFDRVDTTRTFNGFIDDLFLSGWALTPEQAMQYHLNKHKVLAVDGEDIRCIVADDGGLFTANRLPRIDAVNDQYINEDDFFRLELTAQDLNDDELSWEMNTNAGWLGTDVSKPSLYGTPANEDVGVWWVNISVDDGHGGRDHANVTLHVLNINDPPVIRTVDVEEALEDIRYVVRYEAVDVDPTVDELVWNLETNCSFLSIEEMTGLLSGTPQQKDVGSYWVNVSVSDGWNGSDSHYFTLTVFGTNDRPILTEPPSKLEIFEDSAMTEISLDEWFFDPDGDVLHYSIIQGRNLTVMLHENSTVEVRPLPDWSGTEEIVFTAADLFESVSHTLKVIVIPVNDPPSNASILFENIPYHENGYQPARGAAVDPDLPYGDALNFSWHSNISGSIGWGTEVNLSLPAGHHNITLTVTDQEGSSTSVWAHLHVRSEIHGTPDDDVVDDDTADDDEVEKTNWGLIAGIIVGIISLIMVLVIIVSMVRRSPEEAMDWYEE